MLYPMCVRGRCFPVFAGILALGLLSSGGAFAQECENPQSLAPELILLGDPRPIHPCEEVYEEPGFLAHDACGNDLTDAVEVEGRVDVNEPGAYLLTYRVADSAGRETSNIRAVVVDDSCRNQEPCEIDIFCPPSVLQVGDMLVMSVTDPCLQGDPLTYTFYHNGQVVSTNEDGRLIIDAVDCDDAGSYWVTVSNGLVSLGSVECHVSIEPCDQEGEGGEGEGEGEDPATLCYVYPTCFSGLVSPLPSTTPYPADTSGYVTARIDATRPPVGSNPAPIPDVNWQPPMEHNSNPPGPHTFNAANLGQVFGLTLDNQNPPNVYVAATSVYGDFAAGPGGYGAIYRIDGVTNNICILAQLPNGGPALGNIAFVANPPALYASNMEDGLIYRVPIDFSCTPSGPITTYDHGVDGRNAEGLSPIADAGTMNTYTALGRRVWAVENLGNRLFYSVWWENSGRNNSTEDNEIWSVALDANGIPIPATAQRELLMPPLEPNTNWSNPVADITFSAGGDMLLAERTMQTYGNAYPGEAGDRGYLHLGFRPAHRSRMLRYAGSPGGPWTTNDEYRIGSLFWTSQSPGTNAAGGVAMDCCSDDPWATGDVLHYSSFTGHNDVIYGLQLTPAAGNVNDSPYTANATLIGLGTGPNGYAKAELGDVEVWTPDCPIDPGEGEGEGQTEGHPEGEPEGSKEGEGEGHPEGEPEGGVEGEGEGRPEGEPEGGVEGEGEGRPEGEPEGGVEGEGEGIGEDCMRIAIKQDCDSSTGAITLSVNITNLSGVDATTVLLTPQTPGVGLSPQQHAVNLPNGGSTTVSATLSGASPGDEICFTITLLSLKGEVCCSETVCITTDCDGCLAFVDEVVRCVPGVPGAYYYTFSVINLTPDPVEHVYFYGAGGPVNFSAANTYVNISPALMPGATAGPFTLTLNAQGSPGDTVCFSVTAHNGLLEQCCFMEQCIVLPDCDGTSPCETAADCDDGDPCTEDFCDSRTGNCVFVPIPGCGGEGEGQIGGCVSDADCDDGNPCTRNFCDPVTGECLSVPIPGCEGEGEGDPEGEGEGHGGPCVALETFRCDAGVRDGFDLSNGPELLSPSQALLDSVFCQNGALTTLDVMPKAQCVVHTFTDCCFDDCTITGARLAIGLRASSQVPPAISNLDTIRLGTGGNGMWMAPIRNLAPNGTWINGAWNPGNDKVIQLNLFDLPVVANPAFNVSVIEALKRCELDVLVEGYTAVDFMYLFIDRCCDEATVEGEQTVPCDVRIKCPNDVVRRGSAVELCIEGDLACIGENPHFLWFKDGVPIPGTNSPCLVLNPVSCADAGAYSVRITPQGGSPQMSPPCRVRVQPCLQHTADAEGDGVVSLSNLLRAIQFFNVDGLHCDPDTEDGFGTGPNGPQDCPAHAGDYNPQDWRLSLNELLRMIQFFNSNGYRPCPEDETEDGFCPGPPVE